jgi:acetylornithine deacetylase/succinyl-diaminopimelate desuccinylase-like protein
MDRRADPLLAAAKMIVAVNETAVQKGFRATVSMARSSPESMNTIAGMVTLSLDLRAPSDGEMDEFEKDLTQRFDAIGAEHGTTTKTEPIWDSEAEHFDEQMVDCVRQSAKDVECEDEMMSFIGHDRCVSKTWLSIYPLHLHILTGPLSSVYTSKVVPTAMIFTRCRHGISHSPLEYSRPEE